MFINDGYVKQFTDMMSEGFIFIDTSGKIQIYNNKAKEIFGIIYNQGTGHMAGRITEGDIVIIGDNSLGKDDGGLTPNDLKVIGIDDNNIQIGDAILAVGVLGDHKQKAIYKYQKASDKNGKFHLSEKVSDKNVDISIDYDKRIINIAVNDQNFDMGYVNAIGHMVILDKNSGRVKFYQAKGYTTRGEEINYILKGREFRAKGSDVDALNVIGKDIFEIHNDSPTIKEFYEAARGSDISYKDKFTEINGRPTICTLVTLNNGKYRVGAALKVEDISEIKKVIRERDEALLHLEQVEKKLKEEETLLELFPEIIGDSKEIRHVKNLAYRASKSNSTVLILGESGTGKSLFAKAIHKASKYSHHPFIHVNCGSIPEALLESELFGYEGGAFTGARSSGKAGMFELAEGGTIFLDEIGEISPVLQVKLLQVLQNKSFYRVGGNKKITVDVRIIAATNKNLEEEMINGSFREDLYYRINVFPIWIPPLRDRKQDIYSLVYYILPYICKKIGCEEKRISGEALNILAEYHWPGNIRELENILERAVNLAEGNILLSNHLLVEHKGIKNSSHGLNSGKPLKDTLQEAERKALLEALKIHNGNRNRAMQALSIGKTSFYEKLKKYNIE
ncbi:sigma-54 interaction domain-containing protein [Alkaliphilus peptidifermentans]|uniref:Transcriptional regulator containing PAS, AAA-type ATPase, and DNA-binding Fis domains n=1 Tax=Alkaliphilus peptidifermentans DSM 18978 TaxID=1120976 RepID=A0A1G5IVC2_9FIRM|nr:sigma 54-interacting transcriptional regulator [Alkaliphilus peptidifermentans]SCY80043.1 Transcriptional regulator containing PAS, AAA-type ATPase, and DNA-binding Fis domains [Alkaliphilus peptidifermentans DSM 18978]